MKNLPVKYKSQWDDDAGKTRNDCGPASAAMVLNYYGENVTTDEVFEKTGAGTGLITISQLKTAISHYGYSSRYERDRTPDRLRDLIDQNIPAIALVHYGDLPTTQDDYQGGHFFVVVGYREDGYFVNDPNFWGQYREHGDHHFYPKSDFERAWTNSSKDGNPVRSILIIEPKEDNTALAACMKDREDFWKRWEVEKELREKCQAENQQLEDKIATLGDDLKICEDSRKILMGKIKTKNEKIEQLEEELQQPDENCQQKVDKAVLEATNNLREIYKNYLFYELSAIDLIRYGIKKWLGDDIRPKKVVSNNGDEEN